MIWLYLIKTVKLLVRKVGVLLEEDWVKLVVGCQFFDFAAIAGRQVWNNLTLHYDVALLGLGCFQKFRSRGKNLNKNRK